MDPSRRTSRQDACPGALQVHPADDGNLARIRIPGGALSTEQLQVMSEAAMRLGDGHLELTSRGNLQLRGLRPTAEVELGRVLGEAGLLPSLTHERVRNIVGSVLTGRDGSGHMDVRPLVADLDRRLCADPDLAQLSGRFLFAIDDGRDDVSGLRADIGLLATGPDTMALLLAGTDTGVRARSVAAVGLTLRVAHAFLAWRDTHGSAAWRLTELDPVDREACARAAADPTSDDVGSAGSHVPAHRGSGRAVVGVLRQSGGLVASSAAVPLGRLSQAAAAALARAARAGSDEIRVTPWRTVVVPDLETSVAARWSDAIAGAGLSLDRHSALVDVSACAGRPGCARSLADVRGDALRVHTAIGDASRPVHWSGCERDCGRPAGRHVRVRAEAGGYRVGLDGETGSFVANADGETAVADLRAVVTAVRST